MLQALTKLLTSRTPAASARPEQSPPARQVEAIHEGLAEPIPDDRPDDRGQRGRPRPQARRASSPIKSKAGRCCPPPVTRDRASGGLLRGGAAARPQIGRAHV